MKENELKNYRKLAQLIFQDPYAALSPRMTVEQIVAEGLEIHNINNENDHINQIIPHIFL